MTRTCDHCGQTYNPEHSGLTKQVHVKHDVVTYYFCSRNCMYEHYLNQLRKELRA